MNCSWAIATFPPSATAATTPTLSRRRGIQFRAASELMRDSFRDTTPPPTMSDTPFPRKSTEEAAPEQQPVDPIPENISEPGDGSTLRTVRRKKSSLGLRDVFLSEGSQSPSGGC